ncbi:SDR family NAD(P)-dependent oxidoreductase [Deinococcus sp. MIMF12]|uniref:SDR family NAD(P)-dependent oxidoreductase n=1 Tax=Deinococcus rhizophilus TaxID=3049544 RepID=A0ABT7JGE1_9DEIO|nr:SDR family NAD(P)-dependent oxidoreductase [Deinococcus rhizophilus]MDL2344121.1 SDR family NAD(P)-dependent oxidoreductase [Deinococcus rhizophilus]
MLDLTGKVVLVTGGSRGIGAATVRTLAAVGASVIVHYGRSEQQARSLVEEVGGEERAAALGADLAQPGAGAALFREAVAWRGRVDVLVNNAGIAPTVTVDDPDEAWADTWAQTLQVNLVAVADLCREAVRHFRTRGGGTIINVASRAAFRGDNPDAMHYAASKGGVIALTRSIARGYAREGILAYAVAPGWVRTDMAEGYLREHAADLARDIPMGDVVPPEEVAHTIAFLASELARHMTGATLDLNGASYVR